MRNGSRTSVNGVIAVTIYNIYNSLGTLTKQIAKQSNQQIAGYIENILEA